jgi:hypothetical protein
MLRRTRLSLHLSTHGSNRICAPRQLRSKPGDGEQRAVGAGYPDTRPGRQAGSFDEPYRIVDFELSPPVDAATDSSSSGVIEPITVRILVITRLNIASWRLLTS